MGSGSDSRSQTPANMFKPYILSVDPALDPYLSEDAVLDDLRAVHKNWMSQAKKFRKSQQGSGGCLCLLQHACQNKWPSPSRV